MSVSVFLSNKSIQVVIGDGRSKKAKIDRFFEDNVPVIDLFHKSNNITIY